MEDDPAVTDVLRRIVRPVMARAAGKIGWHVSKPGGSTCSIYDPQGDRFKACLVAFVKAAEIEPRDPNAFDLLLNGPHDGPRGRAGVGEFVGRIRVGTADDELAAADTVKNAVAARLSA